MTPHEIVTLVWPHLASVGGAFIGMAFAPASLSRRGRIWCFFAGLFCAMFAGPILQSMTRWDNLEARAFSNFVVGIIALATLPKFVANAVKKVDDKFGLLEPTGTEL